MGGDALGYGDLIEARGAAGPPAQDRFAAWPRWRARAALLVLAGLLLASALMPLRDGGGAGPAPIAAADRPRDPDLALYDRAVARVARGEDYYAFIVSEHRRAGYPVRPGMAVRLPVLAWLDAAMGLASDAAAPGAMASALALMLGVIAAWWGRLGALGVDPSRRRIGTALVFFGAALGLNRCYFVLHELWSGMLLALSLGLHRPEQGRWIGAVLAAGLALAIRELALPFVLLMGVMAAWRGNRREAAAWAGLVLLFAAGWGWHLHRIAAQVVPGDPAGPGWLALRGLRGFLGNTVLCSNLRCWPLGLAGPITVLMLLGWAGWRSSAGATGALLYGGYGLLFAIAGRDDNFYWGAMITPVMALGLVFAPMAAGSLLRTARGRI